MMISAIIHLSNQDFDALATDFVNLGFYPEDVDRNKVRLVIDRVLSPYVSKGGGVNDYSFQNVTQEYIKS